MSLNGALYGCVPLRPRVDSEVGVTNLKKFPARTRLYIQDDVHCLKEK